MKLSSYMTIRGLSDGQFAKMVDASTFAVGKWRREERIPRDPFMQKIVSVTGGVVSPNDFYSSEDVPPNVEVVTA